MMYTAAFVAMGGMLFPREDFTDPAPPTVQKLEPQASPPAQETPGWTFHRAPRPLDEGAIIEDASSFFGPRRDGHSSERPLDLEFDEAGPALVWEVERGEGYASPAIADGRLVFTHRIENEVHVDCLEAETGKRYWRHTIPCTYSGKYIKNSGPRATPTIMGDHVYVHAVDGVLLCLEVSTGRVLWQRDTTSEFGVGHDFFGVVSSPLLVGDLLIQNVGAPKGPSIAAFDRHSGALVWGAGSQWGPSCASPVLASIHGTSRLLVVAGGESRPPTGGLMVLDPQDGVLSCEYPFRSRTYASVNGASPVECDDHVFLTASYGVGSAGVSIGADGACTELWKNRRVGLEFSTPVFEDGLVYAIDGVSGRGGAIVAIDPATGEERARESLWFEETLLADGEERVIESSVGAGSLLHADGAFIVLGDTGRLVIIRAEPGKFVVTAHTTLFRAPETWTPPVITRGLLYVCQNNPARSGESSARLLCYDLRGKAGD